MSEQPAPKDASLEFWMHTPNDTVNPSLILINLLNSKGIGIKTSISHQAGFKHPAGYLAVFASAEGKQAFNKITITDEFECIELVSDPVINPEISLPKLYQLLEHVYLDEKGIRRKLTNYYWQNRLAHLEKQMVNPNNEDDNTLIEACNEAKNHVATERISTSYIRDLLEKLVDQVVPRAD